MSDTSIADQSVLLGLIPDRELDQEITVELVRQPRYLRRRRCCPECSSPARPYIREKINTWGWTIFIIGLLGTVTVLVSWVALFIRDRYKVCPDCGAWRFCGTRFHFR